MATLTNISSPAAALGDLKGDYSWFWCDPIVWCIVGSWCGPIMTSEITGVANTSSNLGSVSIDATDIDSGSNTLTDLEST